MRGYTYRPCVSPAATHQKARARVGRQRLAAACLVQSYVLAPTDLAKQVVSRILMQWSDLSKGDVCQSVAIAERLSIELRARG